ncbi:hypothetical protein GBAR_LOCUS6939, partial [Geodia barretti]
MTNFTCSDCLRHGGVLLGSSIVKVLKVYTLLPITHAADHSNMDYTQSKRYLGGGLVMSSFLPPSPTPP